MQRFEKEKGRYDLEFSDVVSRMHSEGISLRSAYFKEPTLEDVFIRITGKELRE